MPTGTDLNLTGKIFGCLKVLEKSQSLLGKVYWLCECICGRRATRDSQHLTTRNCTRCSKGCTAKLIIDRKKFIGQKFFNRTVYSLEKLPNGNTVALVKCNCGAESKVELSCLKKGSANQCQKCGAIAAGLKNKGRPSPLQLPPGVSASNEIFYNYNKCARKRGITFNLTKEEFLKITQMNCYYCGVKPYTVRGNPLKTPGKRLFNGSFIYNGVDRLNNELYYSKENCVSCCSICNYMKQEHKLDLFLMKIADIYHNHFLPNGQRKFVPSGPGPN